MNKVMIHTHLSPTNAPVEADYIGGMLHFSIPQSRGTFKAYRAIPDDRDKAKLESLAKQTGTPPVFDGRFQLVNWP